MIANQRFRAACLTVLLLSAIFFSAVLYVPQFFEKILGYSTVEAGLGMLPMLAAFAIDVLHRRPALQPDRDADRGRRRRPA